MITLKKIKEQTYAVSLDGKEIGSVTKNWDRAFGHHWKIVDFPKNMSNNFSTRKDAVARLVRHACYV